MAVVARESNCGEGLSSSRKRQRKDVSVTVEEAEKRNTERHAELLAEIRAGNEQRVLFNQMFAELIRKF